MATYFIGPWTWRSEPSGSSMAWCAPVGSVPVVDLRSLRACGRAGVVEGYGVFLGVNPDEDEWLSLADDPLDQVSAPRRAVLAQLFDVAITPKVFASILRDLLTVQADPLGMLRCPPLMPGRGGMLELRLGNGLWREHVDVNGPEWPNIQFVYRALYRRIRARVNAGLAKPKLHRRLLTIWMLETGILDHRQFVDDDLPNESPVDPETTLTENFNAADSGTVGNLLTWTETGGAWDNFSSQARHTGTTGVVDLRAEHDLSSTDHFCQVTMAFNPQADYYGAAVRFSASARTYYWGGTYHGVFGVDPGCVGKVVTGTRTNLNFGSGAWRAPIAGDVYKCEINGSTLKVFRNGAEICAITDTAITGGTRCGIFADAAAAFERFDDWSAEDLSTGITRAPAAGALAFTGLAPTLAARLFPSAGALVLTGLAPNLLVGRIASPPAGALVLTGLAPTLFQAHRATPASGALTLTGLAPSITPSPTPSPPTGALVLTGQTPTLKIGGNFTTAPAARALSLTGLAPTVFIASAVRRLIPTLYFKLNGVWTPNEDVIRDAIRWTKGISGTGPTDLQGRPGTLTCTLDNSHRNSVGKAGAYTPGHVNCVPGFGRDIQVKLHLTDGGTHARYVWAGTVKVITPDAGVYGPRGTTIMAFDWLEKFSDHDVVDLPLLEDVRIDDAMHAMVDAMAVQPANREFEVGADVLAFVFDDLSNVPKAPSITQDLLQSEGAYLYLRGDTTDGETLRLENRYTRALAPSVATFTGNDLFAEDLVVPSSVDHIYNEIEGNTYSRRVDPAATTALIQLDTPIEVPPGPLVRIFLDYQDPTNEAEYVGGKDIEQPDPITDWTANAERDGTGADETANVTVVATPFGSRAMLELTTIGTEIAYVRGPGGAEGLQVRGRGLYRYAPVAVRGINQPSIDAVGSRPLSSPLEMPYQGTPAIGQARVDFIANSYGNLAFINVPTRARIITERADLLEHLIERDIGDRITLSEPQTAVDEADVFIHGIEGELDIDGPERLWLTLAPANTTNVLVWDVGQWDVHMWGY